MMATTAVAACVLSKGGPAPAFGSAETWLTILLIVVMATFGDILTAAAMRRIGDLDDIRAQSGLVGAVRAVLSTPLFFAGVTFMALSFFSLLFALSGANLSLVGPAAAALTFVTNAIAAKVFLKEDVDRRRWIAVLCVCAGVALLSR